LSAGELRGGNYSKSRYLDVKWTEGAREKNYQKEIGKRNKVGGATCKKTKEFEKTIMYWCDGLTTKKMKISPLTRLKTFG